MRTTDEWPQQRRGHPLFDWDAIAGLLREGSTVVLEAADLGGRPPNHVRTVALTALHRRGLLLETRTHDGAVYLRLRTGDGGAG